MMEKAIKQRLLGGLVLVAGAALFLPVLLDGSGAGLTIPPLPAAPEVAGVEAMAPQLEQKVAEAEQAVDAAHAGREEADAPAAEGDVVADAAALAAEEGAAATAAAAAASPKTPVTAPTARPVPPSVPALAKPATPAPVPAVSSKPAAPVPAKPVATAPLPAKPAPTAPKPAAAAVPGAWIVQVASLSSREQAQKLVQQLRGKGYPAVLNPQGDKWKVMVGPELNRAVADSIKNRLAADPELKLNGWVQAYKP
ncbi:MAG: cell division protein [Moraxellaceae bacterium]|jgi:DedD protein|nr:cell division protein [Moraxellaceae bacterium]